jgi:hypothetical protein
MKRFNIRLGNTLVRRGHRADCAQVAVAFVVTADTESEAIAKLKLAQNTLRLVTDHPDIELGYIDLHLENITTRDLPQVSS